MFVLVLVCIILGPFWCPSLCPCWSHCNPELIKNLYLFVVLQSTCGCFAFVVLRMSCYSKCYVAFFFFFLFVFSRKHHRKVVTRKNKWHFFSCTRNLIVYTRLMQRFLVMGHRQK